MNGGGAVKWLTGIAASGGVVFALASLFYAPADEVGKPGGPVDGLTAHQLRQFYEAKKLFLKEFTPEEGLGPLFNGKSCFECHGQPGVAGGEGRDVASTGVVRVGSLSELSRLKGLPRDEIITRTTQDDVHGHLLEGGPAIERKSITSEFPNKYPADCQIEIGTIPKQADFISMRHAGPLFGFGLIDAIDDEDILELSLSQQMRDPRMAGRAVCRPDQLTGKERLGRFGWKTQNPTLLLFTAEAMNVEMGLTTPVMKKAKSAAGLSDFPACIARLLPPEPNDFGSLLARLTYFQALLAPPARGAVTEAARRGEKVFERLNCSFCHVPEMRTAPEVYLVDPDSPAPKFNHIEVTALENRPVRAYSDFLLHDMGSGLADGLPQAGARGGEWRTTPLWGLRLKRFFLHDGRTQSLDQAVRDHGGQAGPVREKYEKLASPDREDLLAFLLSL